jgi:beta-glucosidase
VSESSGFPERFLWGAATSAYQVEGSPLADGAGPSIWHRFSHTPGRTLGGAAADVASDHYRRWREDVDLMGKLGLQAYRMSLAWSRILPAGRGRVNPAGLDFYRRLVDRLLERGITPMVTLYHWDLPAALDDRGGWLNPDVADWFAEYARVAFDALADRVPLWATLNEPWVICHDGYVSGCNAPGHVNLWEAPRVAANLLRAHAAGLECYRAGGWNGKIGLVVNLEPKEAASDSAEDREAAERADVYFNRQYLDPVFFGRWPEGLATLFGAAWPEDADRDLERIARPIDWLGINYYTRKVVRHDDAVWPDRARPVEVPHAIHTETGWETHAPSFTRALRWASERYGRLPTYVTENGAAFPDPPRATGSRVDDPQRVLYLREHLRAARAAIEAGVDLRGYFVWSLMDNLEWSSGYSKRFGIVHVDFETLARTPKASALWYREVVRTNGAAVETPLPAVPG